MAYHFKYKLTEDEYAEYAAYSLWYAPWQRKARLKFVLNVAFVSFIMMVAGIIVSEKIRSAKNHNYLRLGIFILIALIILLLLAYNQEPFRIKNKARKLVVKEENSEILAEREIEINNEGIVFANNAGKSYRKWDSIIKNAVTKEYFYLYINSVQAYIVPKRLFSSQKEIDEFDKFLAEKIPLSSSFRSLGI